MKATDKLLLSGVLGLLSGILCRSFYELPWQVSAGFFVVGFASFLVWLLYRKPLLVIQAIFLCAVALGLVRVAVMPPVLPSGVADQIGEQVSFEGIVVKDPDQRENSLRLTIEVGDELAGATLLVVADPYADVSYGDRVRVAGTLARPEPFESGEGRVFRYDQFLMKDGIGLMVSFANVERLSGREGWWPLMRGVLADVRTSFMDALGAALPEPHASLAAGILVGGKQGLGDSLLDAFTITGLVHIVVLSGYNVMVVAESVLAGVRSFLARRTALIVAGVTIGLFVLAAGAGSASVRAGLMAGIALFGRATNRRYDAFRGLVVAGLAMVIWNPYLLAFDPGFQLSFIATAGLIFGVPLIEPKLGFIRPTLMRELVATTIAAQIAVLPLLLYQTGMLSFASLAANVLVLPAVPLAMGLSLLSGIIGFLIPLAAPLLSFPTYAVLSYLIVIAEQGAALPFAAVSLPAFPFYLVVLSYGVMIWWVIRKTRQQPKAAGASERQSVRTLPRR